MRSDFKIIETLSQSCDSILNNQLIELCQKIAQAYLHFNYKKIIKFLQNEDLTLDEFAIDAIAPLFTKETDLKKIPLMESFLKWNPPIKSEEDALYFLNKVVCHRVEQHIFSYLREEDPFFSKILDSVNYLVRTNGFYKIHYLGKTFITETDLETFEKSFISTDEFEKLPTKLFKNKKTLLEDLFSYLNNETDFNPAIPLNDLINRLKHINFSDFLVNEFVSNEYKKIEVNELIDEGLNTAIEKLFRSYVEKGKLDSEEGKAFESALREMANDLSDGGINPGLYKYLSPHLIELTEEDYQNKYHNILEYLLKVMKNNIALKLTNND